MTEALQPQDLVITLLGTYVRPIGRDTVWSGGLVALLGELGFSHGAARVASTRLVRRGLIARSRSGRLVYYRITDRCDRLLAEGDVRIFSLGRVRYAGDTWTMLWHQIPEDRRLERSRMARRLRFLGFGPVQDSVWVSPHDHAEEVERLLVELDVSHFATLFRGSVAAEAGLPALVARAWDLDGLRERYDAFVAEFSPFERRRVSDADAFLVRTRLVHLFRGFPGLDPELPESLAPVSDVRGRAVQLFHSLFEALAESSQRHFDAAMGQFGVAVSAPGSASGLAKVGPR
jgi:phenylacetic acid degradation operon negative regulatory protein